MQCVVPRPFLHPSRAEQVLNEGTEKHGIKYYAENRSRWCTMNPFNSKTILTVLWLTFAITLPVLAQTATNADDLS